MMKNDYYHYYYYYRCYCLIIIIVIFIIIYKVLKSKGKKHLGQVKFPIMVHRPTDGLNISADSIKDKYLDFLLSNYQTKF